MSFSDVSPLSAISGRSWDSAVFTTYALSLSFVEAMLLPALDTAKCRDVSILVDAHGYRDSLAEQLLSRAGHRYRIIPIQGIEQGIFHPKVALLSHPEEDLLLVGSGNLTYGGWGGNWELVEGFTRSQHPDLITQARVFLNMLATHKDWILLDESPLKRFSGENGEFKNQPAGPRMIHSLQEPVLNQLRQAVEGLGSAQLLTVWTPYLDRDPWKGALGKLWELLGRPALQMVVVSTSHPLDFGCGPTAVKAVRWSGAPDEKTSSRSHAKLIEIRCQHGWVSLAGSINTTFPALCTTKNVEVGILRTGTKLDHLPVWVQTELPQQNAIPELQEMGRSSSILLTAFTDGEGSIHGRLAFSQSLAGEWKAQLFRRGVPLSPGLVRVDDKGEFKWAPSSVQFDSAMTSYQLMLRKDGLEAHGWLNREDLLTQVRLFGMDLERINRAILGEEDDELMAQLFSRLFDAWWQSYEQSPSSMNQQKDARTLVEISEGPSQVFLAAADLQPVTAESLGHETSVLAWTMYKKLAELSRELRRRAHASPVSRTGEIEKINDEEDRVGWEAVEEEEEVQKDQGEEQRRFLDEAQQIIEDHWEYAGDKRFPLLMRRGLVVGLLGVESLIDRKRKKPGDEWDHRATLKHWLGKALSTGLRASEPSDHLDRLWVGAILELLDSSKEVDLSRLTRWVQTYCCEVVRAPWLRASVDVAESPIPGKPLLADDRSARIQLVLQQETPWDQTQQLLAALKERKSLPPVPAVTGRLGLWIRRASEGLKVRVFSVPGDVAVCPCCWTQLSQREREYLRVDAIGFCERGNSLLFRENP